MKKLSMLIAMILCVTIGGVYAAWVYPNANATVDKDVSVGVGLNVESSGAIGSFTVHFDGTPFAVEPIDMTDTTSPNYYKAQFVATGDIILEFTPYANAAVDSLTVYIYVKNAALIEGLQHQNKQIFEIGCDSIENAIELTLTKDSEGKFRTVISDDLVAKITMANEFILKTKPEYEAFEASMEPSGQGVSFSLHVCTNPV